MSNVHPLYSILYKIWALLRFSIPDGLIDPMVQTLNGKNPQQVKPVKPWSSIECYNRAASASTVYIRVNDKGSKSYPIDPDDTFKVDFHFPVIKQIYLHCDKGSTATVDILGTR